MIDLAVRAQGAGSLGAIDAEVLLRQFERDPTGLLVTLCPGAEPSSAEISSGVTASSMSTKSASSTIARCRPRCSGWATAQDPR